VLRHIDHYVLNSSRGMDEPSTLRSGWYCCIRRDSSRWSSFWRSESDRRCFPIFPFAWS